jgi:hypothetical protein
MQEQPKTTPNNINTAKLLIGIAVVMFVGFAGFWSVLAVKGLQGETNIAEKFSALYGLMALYGGVVGLTVSRRWGWFKSRVGRAVAFASLGLLAQELGQVTYSAYTYLWHREIPYPSWGDVGYFGSVILYILAAYSLVKALSVKSASRTKLSKLWIVCIPIVVLAFSYFMFLRDYQYNFRHPLTLFLDFGYPLGQALYIALAILAFVLSRRFLGGVMRSVILFLIFAFALQYVADFMFLYQVSRNTWKTAGANELMYLISYFVMTLALISFKSVLDNLSRGRTMAGQTSVEDAEQR